MKNKLFLLIIIISTWSKLFNQVDSGDFRIIHYQTSKFNCAIFPSKLGYYFNNEKRFTPTISQVDSAELEILVSLEKLNQKLENQRQRPSIIIHNNLDKYYRQYFGYIDKNGDKILYINFLKSSVKRVAENWLKEHLIFKDGGSSFWEVKYNINKKMLFDLHINGHG